MYHKVLYSAIIALLVLQSVASGKKQKKNKRPPTEDENSTSQPNVIAYSTFGFNDVGSYDGFVPSSPDYASFLSGGNQETTTRLYAPAFPTALEATGFGSNYDSQSFDDQPFGMTDDTSQQSSMVQYPQNTMNFFNTPSLDAANDQNKNSGNENEIYNQNTDERNAPVYGTKLNSRNKNKYLNQFNSSQFNQFNDAFQNPSEDLKYFNIPEEHSSHDPKPTYGEPEVHHQSVHNFGPTYSPANGQDYMKPETSNMQSHLKFPKVVDFTKSTLYHPSFENNPTTTPKSSSFHNYFSNQETTNSFLKPHVDYNDPFINPTPTLKDTLDLRFKNDAIGNNVPRPNSFSDQTSSYNYATSNTNNISPVAKPYSDHKKKSKTKPWISRNNNTNTFKYWKEMSPLKGYEYSTNNVNMSFKYEHDDSKKHFTSNADEIEPASSNLIDLAKYQYPENDYLNFKRIPGVHNDDGYSSITSLKDEKIKLNDYSNSYKSLFTTAPTTTTSYWGNVFKSSDNPSFKNHPKIPHYNDELNEEVVNIPKRPPKFIYRKPQENKPNDWRYGNHSPYTSKTPKDWDKDLYNRFKSEEDLLGLRNHDTSHPSYLPNYKPTYNNDVSDDNVNDYKKIIEKWKQSYLKSKYRDSVFREYEGFATEEKPLHVPVPKPYPIEIPHPVIVPVPEPYPVRVPVSKPIPVPVVRELSVPIVKPVPYPVIKKVPYPVEKLVPVPVEKEVPVPIVKPYPVHIPYIKPVFHHSRPMQDEFESDHEDDDYKPRPESSQKNLQYRRRPYNSRNRSRRPSRTVHQERNSRRSPERRRPETSNIDQRRRRPNGEDSHSVPYKYRQFESEVSGDDQSDYLMYCKRTGYC